MDSAGREIDSVFSMIQGAGGAEEAVRKAREQARGLPCWHGPVAIDTLNGGLSNVNLIVTDARGKYVVKLGVDVPSMNVVRANEVRAMRAAHAAGVAPEVIHAEPGAIVLRFVEGNPLSPQDAREPARLEKIARLLRRLHRNAHKHLDGPDFCFWAPHHCRWYLDQCEKSGTLDPRWRARLDAYRGALAAAEEAVGAVHVAFCHNDTLPQNFIDDGQRLWLVDWEYAGFNALLFDLAGIGMNVELGREEIMLLLETYFDKPASAHDHRRFVAMMLIAALRETGWSFLKEVTPGAVAFDYSIYSTMNAERFERLHDSFSQL